MDEAHSSGTYSTNPLCSGWPRQWKGADGKGKAPLRLRASMTRADSHCDYCDISYAYVEHHEDHDDGPRHHDVWLHYFFERNPLFCEICDLLPNNPGSTHDNGPCHKGNLLRLRGFDSRLPPEDDELKWEPLLSSPEETKHEDLGSAPMCTLRSVMTLKGVNSSRVLVDGGATIHATAHEHLCFDVSPCSVVIAGVGGVAFTCLKKGSLIFKSADRIAPIILTDVHIAPEFPTTFINESVMVRKGCSVLKTADGGAVTSNATGLLFRLEEIDGLYYAVGELGLLPRSVMVQLIL